MYFLFKFLKNSSLSTIPRLDDETITSLEPKESTDETITSLDPKEMESKEIVQCEQGTKIFKHIFSNFLPSSS